jgi:hypothetical protein
MSFFRLGAAVVMLGAAWLFSVPAQAQGVTCTLPCGACMIQCSDGTTVTAGGSGTGGGSIGGVPDPTSSPSPETGIISSSNFGNDYPVKVTMVRKGATTIGPAPSHAVRDFVLGILGLDSLAEPCWGTSEMIRNCRIQKLMQSTVFLAAGPIASVENMSPAKLRALYELARKVELRMLNGAPWKLPSCTGAVCQTAIGAAKEGWDYEIILIGDRANPKADIHAVTWVRNGNAEGYLSWGEIYGNLEVIAQKMRMKDPAEYWRGDLADFVTKAIKEKFEISSPAEKVPFRKPVE